MAALCQAIPYMPVHTDINPVVCCCYVYICGPVASLNGQQLLFVWIIGTRLFQQFRQPIRVQPSWPLSFPPCPCLATDDCTSSLERSTHRSSYLPFLNPQLPFILLRNDLPTWGSSMWTCAVLTVLLQTEMLLVQKVSLRPDCEDVSCFLVWHSAAFRAHTPCFDPDPGTGLVEWSKYWLHLSQTNRSPFLRSFSFTLLYTCSVPV